MTLHALAAGLEQIQQDATLRPLHYFRWLPCQLAFLKHTGSRVLLRAGNQWAGKTTAGVAELLYRLEGFHPYKDVRPGPITALVITATHEQSQNIQRRIHELVDPRLLTDDTVWDPAKGAYRGKYPRVRLRSGSTAVFRSGRGDTLQIAGLTVDYVWIDEPPTSMRVYSEAQKRLLRTGGDLRLTCTPVNAPVEWLRQAVEGGQVEEVHARLTADQLVPVGADSPSRLADGTLADQDWIDSIIAETLPHEVPVVIHGEWRMTSLTPCFTAWDPSGMVIEAMPSGDMPVFLGLDHGAGKHGSSCALVIAVQAIPGEDVPNVYVLSEYVSGDLTHADHDASGVLEAIERVGLTWRDLTAAHGDRPHHGSNKRGSVAKKSNALLSSALGKSPKASAHGIAPGHIVPPIRNAKKGKGGPNAPGAVAFGVQWLNRCMLRGRFFVHRRCVNLRQSIQAYEMRPNTEHSHLIDALRYGLKDTIYADVRHTRAAPRVAFR